MEFKYWDEESDYLQCGCCTLIMNKSTADYKYDNDTDEYLCWDCFHKE